MSTQQLDSDTEYVEVTVRKTKVGPLTARYVAGEGFVDVDPQQASDKPTRRVLIGLDNSHSSDYKVGYASDPVIAIYGGPERTFKELRETLTDHGVCRERFRKTELPYGRDGYKRAYVSSASDAWLFETYISRLKDTTDREMDFRRGESGASGFIPKP